MKYSDKNKPIIRFFWLPVCLILLTLIFILFLPSQKVLSVTNRKNNKESLISKQAVSSGFIISYTHSVNKGRIHDYYETAEYNELLMDRSRFVSYGAGIIEPDEEENLEFEVFDGGYEIHGMNRIKKQFLVAVGTIADHTIAVSNDIEISKEYHLDAFFRQQTSLILEIKRISLLKYITKSVTGRNLDTL